MTQREMLGMVARLGILSGVLGWMFFQPTPVKAGACTLCTHNWCYGVDPSGGYMGCNGDGKSCIQWDPCGWGS